MRAHRVTLYACRSAHRAYPAVGRPRLERRHFAYRRNDYSHLLTVSTSTAIIGSGLRTTLPTYRRAGTTLNTLSTKVTASARGSMTDVLADGVFWCARTTTPRASLLSVVPEVVRREAVVRGEQYLLRSRASPGTDTIGLACGHPVVAERTTGARGIPGEPACCHRPRQMRAVSDAEQPKNASRSLHPVPPAGIRPSSPPQPLP